MELINEKINIIRLIKNFEISQEDRTQFLFTLRTFIKNVSDSTDTNLNLTIRSLVKTEFEIFNGNQVNIVNKITEFARSILNRKNKSFSNLLISLISNYLNALKFDLDKHVILYYPGEGHWDNINAIKITDLFMIDNILKIYTHADDKSLENTTISYGKINISVENLKIKTKNNYEKSIIDQKITEYRNTLIKECDSTDLQGKARNTYINTRLSNFKANL